MHQTQWSAERPLRPPVSLTSQSHHEKPPEVTCTSRGNPGFPASTRDRPRETFFNTSRGHIPLPWLGSNDALPLAIRMETRRPCRPENLSVPLEGDRDFGELCGSYQGCQVPFRPPIPNVGLLLRRCSEKGLRGGGAGKPQCSSRGRPGFRGTLWVVSRVPSALSTSNS